MIVEQVIGQDAVRHSGVVINMDESGAKLVRKDVVDNVVNVVKSAPYFESIKDLDPDMQKKIEEIIIKYPKILPTPNYIGNVNTGELVIKQKSAKNVYYRPYRLFPLEREKVKVVSNLLQAGIIHESDSPYASPVLLVKKRDGSDRICVDFRALNAIIERDRYPLPLIQDEIAKLGKAIFFIAIDTKNGFQQIPVHTDSVKLTAFVTPDGHYEFIKMPYGIGNGPCMFQRAISKALQHLKFLQVYMDDILIPCTSIEQGLKYLDFTLAALSKAGFTINLKKCQFFVKIIKYLGWSVIS